MWLEYKYNDLNIYTIKLNGVGRISGKLGKLGKREKLVRFFFFFCVCKEIFKNNLIGFSHDKEDERRPPSERVRALAVSCLWIVLFPNVSCSFIALQTKNKKTKQKTKQKKNKKIS
jgi:hypothetical protein